MEEVDLSEFEHGRWCQAALNISKTANLVGFTENGPEKRKFPVSGSSLCKNALWMPEISGKWQDCFKLIERQY